MKLRDYQLRAVEAAIADFREAVSTLIVCATGLGKTVILSHVGHRLSGEGRVMVIAHREELVRQAADKYGRVTGETPDIEMAGERADQPNLHGHRSRCVVASVQTLVSGMGGAGRMTRFDPSEFALLVIDEAHHATADTYRRVIAHFRQNPRLKVLGVTATPDRADEEALGQVFDRVAFVYEINDGISDGWLAPVEQRIITVEGLDFSGCRTTAGDLNGADLSQLMEFESNLHGIAHPTYELAAGRKTLMFAASVAHAERLCEILNRHRQGCARFVCGATDDVTRARTLREYTSGQFQFLVNVGVFTEGFDEDSIQVVAVARPTKSRSLYTQMVGRGTRTLGGVVDGLATPAERIAAIAASGKPRVEVFDFVGNAGRHKLMTTADILGGNYSDDVVEQAKREAAASSEPVNVQLLLEQVARAAEEQRARVEAARALEAANRAKLVAKANYSVETVDPFDVLDIRPAQTRGWDKGRPATDKQVEFLRQKGIGNAAELTHRHASQLIGGMMERFKKSLCTFKQARTLKKYGYSADVTMAEATRIIDAIAANGWKRPVAVDPGPDASRTVANGSVAVQSAQRVRVTI